MARSHSTTSPVCPCISPLATASYRTSDREKAIRVHQSVCPTLAAGRAVATPSRNLIVPSVLAAASCNPSGENSRQVTGEVCCVQHRGWAVAESNNHTLPSTPPTAKDRSTGDNASAVCGPDCRFDAFHQFITGVNIHAGFEVTQSGMIFRFYIQ